MIVRIEEMAYPVSGASCDLGTLFASLGLTPTHCVLELEPAEEIRITEGLDRSFSCSIRPSEGSVVRYHSRFVGEVRGILIPERLFAVKVEKHILVDVAASGALVDVLVTAHICGDQQMTLVTEQLHRARGSSSNVLIRGVCQDRGRAAVKSTITITPEGQQTSAHQKHVHLLLDTPSRAVSDPQLEVSANDVQCSHGAAIGPISEEEVFYLKSRGLCELDARQLIVQGFLQNVF